MAKVIMSTVKDKQNDQLSLRKGRATGNFRCLQLDNSLPAKVRLEKAIQENY